MKSKNETAVLTTLFELEWDIAYDFFNSLNMQDVKDFDILVVNDGFTQLGQIRKIFTELCIVEINGFSSIAKNRENLIRYAMNNYQKAIFCDFDDYFSTNRVGLSIEELKRSDIVFNDVSLFRGSKMTQENRFSNDFLESHIISISDLMQKNYLGLSNTAINLKILNGLELSFDESLIAVDWYFFSILMLRGYVAKFTKKAITYYRQHDNNTANIESFNYSQMINEIRVKKSHYTQMSKVDPEFCVYLEAIDLFSAEFISDTNTIDHQKDMIFKCENQAWWSLIKLSVGTS